MEYIDNIVLLAGGILLIATSVAIFRKQSLAKHCDLHNHRAGQIAVVAALLALVAGITTTILGCFI